MWSSNCRAEQALKFFNGSGRSSSVTDRRAYCYVTQYDRCHPESPGPASASDPHVTSSYLKVSVMKRIGTMAIYAVFIATVACAVVALEVRYRVGPDKGATDAGIRLSSQAAQQQYQATRDRERLPGVAGTTPLAAGDADELAEIRAWQRQRGHDRKTPGT